MPTREPVLPIRPVAPHRARAVAVAPDMFSSMARMKEPETKNAKKPATGAVAALAIEQVEVDEQCTGSRWTVVDIDRLARIIAIIAMWQKERSRIEEPFDQVAKTI